MALTQVKSDGIATGAVTADQIATGAVTANDLEDSGVTAGTYGSSSAIPAITVDAKGRVTSATTNAINVQSDQIFEGNTNAECVDTGSDGHFKVVTEGVEALRVNASQNVGFGTISPTNKIHSYASNNAARTDHIRLQNDGADNGTESAITFTANSASEQACIFSTKDASGPSLNIEISGAQMGRFTNNGQFIVGTVPSSLPASTLVVEGSSDGTDGNPTLHFSRQRSIGSATGLGIVSFGKNNLQGARIYGISNGTWTEGSAHPTDIVFETVPNSSTTLTPAAKILKGGEFQFNSGYGSVATAYGVRAWVEFDGRNTPTIRSSGNVSSITDLGTGSYYANFTNAMPDVNYVGSGHSASGLASGNYFENYVWPNSTSRGNIRTQWNGGNYDVDRTGAIFVR